MKKRWNARLETGRWVFGSTRKPRLFWFHFWRRDLRHLFVSGSWYCQIQTTWLIMFFIRLFVCNRNIICLFFTSFTILNVLLMYNWCKQTLIVNFSFFGIVTCYLPVIPIIHPNPSVCLLARSTVWLIFGSVTSLLTTMSVCLSVEMSEFQVNIVFF